MVVNMLVAGASTLREPVQRRLHRCPGKGGVYQTDVSTRGVTPIAGNTAVAGQPALRYFGHLHTNSNASTITSSSSTGFLLLGTYKGNLIVCPLVSAAAAVPGVTFAEAGSTLCGTGVCPTGQRCFDGWNCCPEATPICGAKCCQAPSVCLNNRCVEPGSVPCGTTVCEPAQTCGLNNVCCTADRKVCGTACCEVGQDCVLGTCAAAGSVACGATAICTLGQTCVSGVCCNTGETACGGRCCPAGNECLQVSCAGVLKWGRYRGLESVVLKQGGDGAGVGHYAARMTC